MSSHRRGGLNSMARETVVWDATPLPAELATIDLLARITLAARGRGIRLVFGGVSPALRDLIDLVGLAAVLPGFRALSPWCFRHQSD